MTRSVSRHAVTLVTLATAFALLAPQVSSAQGYIRRERETGREAEERKKREEEAQRTANEDLTKREAGDGDVLTKLPELVTFVQATYPAEAEAAGLEADVVLLILVDEQGNVENVSVQAPVGNGFDEAALAAAKQFKFSPAQAGETPVAVQITYSYKFRIAPTPPTPTAQSTPPDVETPASETPQAQLPVNVRGRIVEKGTQSKIVAVEVLRVDTGETVYASDEGDFEFRGVPTGRVNLRFASVDHVPAELEVDVTEGEVTELKVFLTRVAYTNYELTVRAERPQTEVTRRTISVEVLRKIPGTQGDTLKVIELLPGAGRTPGGLGGLLILRGNDPAASAVFVDNIKISRLFHFGGLRSVINSDLVLNLNYLPGNFGPRYGDSSGGVVDVETRDPKTDRFHGKAELNIYEGGFLLEGPISETVSIAGAFHRSWYDLVIPAALPADAALDFTVLPRYYDYQLKLLWKATPRDDVEFFFYGLGDQLGVVASKEESDAANTFSLSDRYHILVNKWTSRLDKDITNTLQSYVGYSHFTQQVPFVLAIDIPQVFAGAFDRVNVPINDQLSVNAGAQLQYTYTDLAVVAPQITRQGEDGTGGSNGGSQRTTAQKLNAMSAGIFGEVVWQPLKELRIAPGFRGDYFDIINKFSIDPRMSVRYQPIPITAIKAGIGKYAKAPQPQFSSPGFGNPDLDPEFSIQYSAGIEQQITDLLSVDLVGFYNDQHDLAASNPEFQRNPSLPPYVSEGKGRSYGMEVWLKHAPSQWFTGWIAYTLSRSERFFPSDGEYKLFNFDQPHNVAVVLLFTLPYQIDIGVRFRYVSGRPADIRTVRGGLDADTDQYISRTQDLLEERLPATHSLDLRIDKTFVFDTVLWTIYLDVQNVYNNRNIEGITYSYDFGQRDFFRGLPILPTFGTVVEF